MSFYSMGSVENEDHFLLECTVYRQLREDFFRKLNGIGINIINTNCASASSNWYCLLNSKNRSNFGEVDVAPAPSLLPPSPHLPPADLGENMCRVSKRPALNYMRSCNHKVPTVYIYLRSVNEKVQN